MQRYEQELWTFTFTQAIRATLSASGAVPKRFDHTQIWTGSAGLSYLWWGTLFTTDMIFGSGLRNGDANIGHVPAYTQINAGVSDEFKGLTAMPFTLRFDVVNVFDTVYLIRDGSGIGVFAPQYGPRRGFFAGYSQKL